MDNTNFCNYKIVLRHIKLQYIVKVLIVSTWSKHKNAVKTYNKICICFAMCDSPHLKLQGVPYQ